MNKTRILLYSHDTFGLDHFQAQAEIKPQPNIILSGGRLAEKKEFDNLIRACHLLKQWGSDFHCNIIGRSDLRDSLRTLITELDLPDQIRLIDPQAKSDILAAYHQSAILALPCIIGSEDNGDVRPIASPILASILETIDPDQNGLIVLSSSDETLAYALAILLQNHTYPQKMGAAARPRTERAFDVRQFHRWLAASFHDPAYQTVKVVVDSPYSPLV